MDLTPDVIFSLLQSSDPFPVDFDDAMTWWDWRTKTGELATKGNIKIRLEAEFNLNLDYTVKEFFAFEISKAKKGGQNKEVIKLTVDCFKSMGMMVPGDRGKQIRRYFLECEAQLKQRIYNDKQNHNLRVLEAYINKDKLPWRKKFEDEFYREIYRLRGWQYDPDSVKRTPFLGHITNDIVYNRLQPNILEELRRRNPVVKGKRKYCHHEFLTLNIGNPHLKNHLKEIIRLMRACTRWKGFIALLNKLHPTANNVQSDIFFQLLEEGSIDFEQWENLAG
jgi:phage anti-repressor protein